MNNKIDNPSEQFHVQAGPILRCRACGAGELTEVLSLGMQGLVDFPQQPQMDAPKYPLDLLLCMNKGCSLVQLRQHVPPVKMFAEHYWYRSGINESMRRELSDIVHQACSRADINEGDWVLDIGANDGTLLKQYPAHCAVPLTRIAVEPSPLWTKIAERRAANQVYHDFFPCEAILSDHPRRFKVVTAIAMAYDLPMPLPFFQAIEQVMTDDGLAVVQVGYLGDLIRMNSFDQVCHEHVEYYSLTSLSWLLAQAGLIVEDVVMNSTNGGSIRCYIRKAVSGAAPNHRVLQLLSDEESCGMHEPGPYLLLGHRIAEIKARVRDIVRAEQGNATVYGASTKGLVTLQYFGLDYHDIVWAAERSEEKWTRYYGNTGIPIVSEEVWRGRPSLAIVLPWHFREAMLEREKDWLAEGGRFLFPLPSPRVEG